MGAWSGRNNIGFHSGRPTAPYDKAPEGTAERSSLAAYSAAGHREQGNAMQVHLVVRYTSSGFRYNGGTASSEIAVSLLATRRQRAAGTPLPDRLIKKATQTPINDLATAWAVPARRPDFYLRQQRLRPLLAPSPGHALLTRRTTTYISVASRARGGWLCSSMHVLHSICASTHPSVPRGPGGHGHS